jgi:predicted TIM-barrel fold metal-dependent hydrolase
MQPGKIDAHHHFFPAVYVDAVGWELLAAVMPGGKPPTWSAQAALEMMEENGIETAILSISAGPSLPKASQLLRSCNEAAADLRRVYPGRFGSFASLPLPDLDASLREIEFASERLGVHGFILFTSYGGKYLGDPHFAPILEELDRRGARAFLMFDSIGQEGLNALNVAMAEQFEQLCERLVAQRSIRVLMLSGNGRAFMAGAISRSFARRPSRSVPN